MTMLVKNGGNANVCVCVCARTLPPPPPPPPDDKNNNRHSRVIFVTATIPLPSTAVAASRRRFCKVKYTYWQRRWRSDATLRRTKREQNKKYIKKNNTGKWKKKKNQLPSGPSDPYTFIPLPLSTRSWFGTVKTEPRAKGRISVRRKYHGISIQITGTFGHVLPTKRPKRLFCIIFLKFSPTFGALLKNKAKKK